jgi:FtsH-binding integral membrane protein
MKHIAGILQVVIFYALGIMFMLFSLSQGWEEFEENAGYQTILAAFFVVGIVWLLFSLYHFITRSESLSEASPVLVNLAGIGLCVGYLLNVEEGNAKHLITQPTNMDTVAISGDTLLGIQKGDTIFYRIGDSVLIDFKDGQPR